MEETNRIEKRDSAEGEVSLKSLVINVNKWYRFFLNRWKFMLSAVVFGGILGFSYAYFKKPVYTADCTFVLEDNDKVGGLGAYASLASMVGIDLIGGSGGVFQGDNILELYKSRKMLQQTLLSKYRFNSKEELLIERFITSNHWRNEWKDDSLLTKIRFDVPEVEFTSRHDSIIGEAIKVINKRYLDVSKPDKKLSIIKVSFKHTDELFSKAFVENIVATVNRFYIETKTKKSAENLSILQRQADSVRNILDRSIGKVAVANDANPNSNPALQILRVPSQKSQVDVQASAAVYQEVVKNLELAKVAFRRDKPLIQIIDAPILPLTKKKASKIASVVLGGVLSLLICVLVIVAQEVLNSIGMSK